MHILDGILSAWILAEKKNTRPICGGSYRCESFCEFLDFPSVQILCHSRGTDTERAFLRCVL